MISALFLILYPFTAAFAGLAATTRFTCLARTSTAQPQKPRCVLLGFAVEDERKREREGGEGREIRRDIERH